MNNNNVKGTSVPTKTDDAVGSDASEKANNYQEDNIDMGVQEKHELMGFVNAEEVHTVGIKSNVDPTMHYETFTDASLENFFNRPVRLTSYDWVVGTNLDVAFTPWKDYFTNTSVKQKLDNFYLMRCNLHVKFQINGSPFHYGRVMVGYQPLNEMNWNHDPDQFTALPLQLLKLSCLPHGFLDPTSQSTLQMDLPFIKQTNYITPEEMVNGVAREDALGKLFLKSTYPLEAVSATAALTIPISVFAWASDVELAVPTYQALSGKSKKKKKTLGRTRKHVSFASMKDKVSNAASTKLASLSQVTIPPDEEKDGLISSISSVAAAGFDKLRDVPMIGQYADMAKGVANGVTSVARFFGFSRPPIMADYTVVKNMPFSSVALTQGAETVSKLTFDPKQSVSIDPAITAMGEEDELALKMFTNKEALISTILWSSSDATDTELFWANVVPTYTRSEVVTHGTRFAVTPLCFAAMPFKFWSGSIVFRFQFVASAYHTGRIRICFEPGGANYNANNYNLVYSQIVDLDGTTDVSFIVPWAQPVPYKKVPSSWYNQMFIPPSGIKNYDSETCNGILYLSVLNPLISPDALKDVTVNIYARGGEDFELSVPASNQFVSQDIVPFAPVVSTAAVGNSALSPDKLTQLFGESLDSTEIAEKNSVFFGEVVTSFRPLLKRYQNVGTRCTQAGQDSGRVLYHQIYGYAYPPWRGSPDFTDSSEGAYSTGNNLYPYNFNQNSLVNYISSAFLGYKGALRWKFLPFDYGTTPKRIAVYRKNIEQGNSNMNFFYDRPGISSLSGDTAAITTGKLSLLNKSLWEGAYVAPGENGQPGAEVEIPWYSNLRFSSTDVRRAGTYVNSEYDTSEHSAWLVEAVTVPTLNSDFIFEAVETYVATGEDFQCNFFLGPPAFYTSIAEPTPSDPN